MARACKSADEYDAFTGWRHVLHWHPGELRKVKRRAAKRERRIARVVIEQEERQPWSFGDDTLDTIAACTGDCQHGCNGSPCGSERCSFICHEDG